MSISFKQFVSHIKEGRQSYSSESYWKGDAEAAGYKVKKLSGDLTNGDQTWGAFNDKDEKVGEFTEKEEGRGGWLIEGQINEIFGIFRNNEKKETPREKLKRETAEKVEKHRAEQAKRNGQGKGKEVDPDQEEDDDEEDDRKKKMTSDTRSGSTKGTKKTMSAAQGRAAERDWLGNMK